jgi:hypothetical protein
MESPRERRREAGPKCKRRAPRVEVRLDPTVASPEDQLKKEVLALSFAAGMGFGS